MTDHRGCSGNTGKMARCVPPAGRDFGLQLEQAMERQACRQRVLPCGRNGSNKPAPLQCSRGRPHSQRRSYRARGTGPAADAPAARGWFVCWPTSRPPARVRQADVIARRLTSLVSSTAGPVPNDTRNRPSGSTGFASSLAVGARPNATGRGPAPCRTSPPGPPERVVAALWPTSAP